MPLVRSATLAPFASPFSLLIPFTPVASAQEQEHMLLVNPVTNANLMLVARARAIEEKAGAFSHVSGVTIVT